MTEYLCRGKRLDNGEWAIGYLMRRPSAAAIGDSSPWCIQVPPADPDDIVKYCWVDPESIGRCTGLRDTNGKLIFEGDDLCDYFDDDAGDNVLGSLGFVTYRTDGGRWVLADENGYSNEWTLEDEAQPENWHRLFVCGTLLGGGQDG